MMRIVCLFIAITFFSHLGLANPHDYAPDNQTEDTSSVPQEKIELEKQELAITPAPKVRKNRHQFSNEYRATQALHIRIGNYLDLKDANESGKAFFGGGYLMNRIHSPRWEIGGDLISNAQGVLYLFRKTIYRERRSFRPFYKYGVSHRLVPRESLASLVNYKNYQLAGGTGFEYILLNPISLRLELEAHAGIQFLFAGAFLGISFGW